MAASIFNGNFIKLLKNQLKLGDTAEVRTGTGDPNGVVTSPMPSLFLREDTGAVYKKTINGGNTGWVDVTAAASGANVNLSNLSSVAINSSLLVDTDNLYDVGSSTAKIRDIYVGRNALVDGNIEWAGGNVTYVPIGADINTYITNATAGDTLVLSSGTYTVTTEIAINKSIYIKGQGISATTIASSSAGIKAINVSSSNVRITDLNIIHTGTGSTYGISISGNITSITLRNIVIVMSGAGAKYGIVNRVANVNLAYVQAYVTSSDSTAYGYYIYNDSGAGQNTSLTLLGFQSQASGASGAGSRAVYIYNNNTSYTLTAQLTQCWIKSLPGGSDDSALEANSTTTNNVTIDAYQCVLNGADFDVKVAGTNVVNLYGCTLVNNLISGASPYINFLGYGEFAGATIGTDSGFVKKTAGVLGVSTTNPDQIAIDTFHTTGMLSSTDTTLAFNTSTKKFTVTKTGTDFSFYSSGVKFTKTTVQEVDLTSIWTVNTLFYIYFNTSGTLAASASVWDIISGNSPVATVFWNGTSTTPILADERHKSDRNLAWHKWAHDTIGTRYKSGLAGTFTSSSTVIDGGVLEDEDLTLTITPQTNAIRISHRDATNTKITYEDTISAISALVVTGALKWDNNGSMDSVASGNFVRNFIYGIADINTPILCIVGQHELTNLNDARANNFPAMPTFISAEIKLLYSAIWQNVGGTPTFIEASDYRTAPTQPNGALATRPIFLDEIEDVSVPTPQLDQVLRYNGTAWVNGAPATSSAAVGIDFFQATPQIIAGTINTNNLNPLSTLSKTPVTTGEQLIAIPTTAANVSVLGRAFLYNTAIGRTKLDGGIWTFVTYAGVSSVGNGRLSTITRNLYQVVPGVGTLSTTSTGASRTATASTGTPFIAGDGTANLTTCSYIQTPQGLYPITVGAVGADAKVATITVPNGTPSYANETNIAAGSWLVWKRVITATTPTITAISPAYTQINVSVAYPDITVAATDKLGSIIFGTTSTNNATTITTTYDGSARNSHVTTPLITLHNNQAGVQGLVGDEAYHLTLAQHTIATQAATDAVSGYLSSTDHATFVAKQAALPNQATHDGQFLTTDGANLSWAAVSASSASGVSGLSIELLETKTNLEKSGIFNTISNPLYLGESFTSNTSPVLTPRSAASGTTVYLDIDKTDLDLMNATTGWTKTSAESVSQNTVTKCEGTGSVSCVLPNQNGVASMYKVFTAFSLVNRQLNLSLYLDTVTNVTMAWVALLSTTNNDKTYYIPVANLAVGWNHLSVDVNLDTADASNGAFNPASVTRITLGTTTSGAQTVNASWDFITYQPNYPLDIPYLGYIWDGTNQEEAKISAVAGTANHQRNTYTIGNLSNTYLPTVSYIKQRSLNVSGGQAVFSSGLTGSVSSISYDLTLKYFPETLTNKTLTMTQRFWDEEFKVYSVPNTTSLTVTSTTNKSIYFKSGDKIILYNKQWNGTKYESRYNSTMGANAKLLTLSADATYAGTEITLTFSAGTNAGANTSVWYVVRYSAEMLYKLEAATSNGSMLTLTPTIILPRQNGIDFYPQIVAYYPLNEKSGDALDTRSGLTLTQSGVVPSTSGKISGARGVYSATNYFSRAMGGSSTSIFDSGLFAISGWFNCTALSVTQMMFSKGNGSGATQGWSVYASSVNNKFYFTLNGIDCVSGPSVADSLWHFFFCAVRAVSGTAEVRMYLDTALQADVNNGVTLTAGAQDLIVGQSNTGSVPCTTTVLDSLAYWNLAGTPYTWAQLEIIIAQLYNNGNGLYMGTDSGYTVRGSVNSLSGDKLAIGTKLTSNSSSGYSPILLQRDAILV